MFTTSSKITKKMNYFLVAVFFLDVIYNAYMESYWFIPKMLGWLFYFVLGMFIRDDYESIDISAIEGKHCLLIITVYSYEYPNGVRHNAVGKHLLFQVFAFQPSEYIYIYSIA
jgi:hypothetical protein